MGTEKDGCVAFSVLFEVVGCFRLRFLFFAGWVVVVVGCRVLSDASWLGKSLQSRLVDFGPDGR